MIVSDHSASQQRRGTLVNRYAHDQEDAIAKGTAWEDYVGIGVVPRRSPWRTVGEDIESANPTVSDDKVSITPQNIQTVSTTITQSAPATIDQNALIAAVTQGAVIAAIVAALPVVEFSCPE